MRSDLPLPPLENEGFLFLSLLLIKHFQPFQTEYPLTLLYENIPWEMGDSLVYLNMISDPF
jgi:hypothetical protein